MGAGVGLGKSGVGSKYECGFECEYEYEYEYECEGGGEGELGVRMRVQKVGGRGSIGA